MESITLGQISVTVAFLVGLISGIGYLMAQMKKWVSKAFKEEFEPINKKIDTLQDRIDQVDMESCKNYLVGFLADVEQDQLIDEIEKERFWEQYQHYEKMGGNSYIHRKVEQLKTEHKL